MSVPVVVDKQVDYWAVTLNRPDKRNALSGELVEGLIEVVEQAQAEKPALLVLRGEGKNFSAGFDFTDWQEASEGDLLWRFVRIEQLLQMLQALPVLTLALAHGKNFGAGVDLMAVCKHRVASDDATFRMPGLKFGLVLGTRRLARLVGVQTTRQIQQVAKTLNASEAHTTGLVSALAEPEAWPHVIKQQGDIATSLTPSARASLYRVLDENTDAQDMADLVRSVTEPGLKDRIAKYLAAR
ncbi:MAG TPA: enoyl-CoA hydratase/isomerase family protein [Orrella sp.]